MWQDEEVESSLPRHHQRRSGRWWLLLSVAGLMAASAMAYLNLVPGQWFRTPFDKVAHFIAFGAVAYCLPPWLPAGRASLALWIPLALAGADEMTQTLSRRRSPDVLDFAADAAGIGLAYLLTMWITTLRTKR